jgi:HlyD family secretion protein
MTFHQTRRLPAWSLALVLLLAYGCELDGAVSGHAVSAAAEDLIREVAVTGTLTSHDFEPVVPPSLRDARSFKIIRLAAEGSTVKVGDEVVAFDTSELENTLKDRSSEADSLVAQLGQARSEAELDALKGRREIEQATALQSQKSRLADKPAALTAGLDLRIASIDRDLAQRQIISLREREHARSQQSEAAQAILRERLSRVQARVTELQAEIAAMSVKARRAGTIIYKPNWRGEKKKVGDSV